MTMNDMPTVDTPEYPGDQPDQPGQPDEKMSQQEANYRRGYPLKHCGVCVYYEGDASKSCSQVEGPISGFGISDVFRMQQNPFGTTIGPQERAVINSMMNSPPDQSSVLQQATPAASRVQIGSKTY